MNRQGPGEHNWLSLGMSRLADRFRLAKFPLCLLVAFSAFFGSVMADSKFSFQLFCLTTGVLLVACGAATYNSLQEADVDSSMERTCRRPLPAGKITAPQALQQALVVTALGLLVTAAGTSSPLPVLLLVASVILYNGIYTRLKEKTVLAILPGAVCGALPPCIGWLAAGGSSTDPTIFMLFGLFFLWQLPHFWLIVLHYKGDYHHAATPTMLTLFSEQSLKRIIVCWVGALTVSFLTFTLIVQGVHLYSRFLVALNGLLLLVIAVGPFYGVRKAHYRRFFLYLNGSFFFTLLVLCCDRLFVPALSGLGKFY